LFGEENKFALGVIDGSLEGGEGDMLREVWRGSFGQHFLLVVSGEDSHCLGLDIFLVGKHNRLFVGAMGFPWGEEVM